MKPELPTAVIPLLLVAWLGQVRLYRGMQGEEFVRERAIARYGGAACLAAAIGLFFVQFVC